MKRIVLAALVVGSLMGGTGRSALADGTCRDGDTEIHLSISGKTDRNGNHLICEHYNPNSDKSRVYDDK